MTIVFYVAGAVAIVSTALMITRLHAVHALLYLIVSLLGVAVAFYTLGAPFVAALEVIIYAGAIMVLFVFVVMLLNLGEQAARAEGTLLKPSMWIGPLILAGILMGEFVYLLVQSSGGSAGRVMVGPREVGASLFGPYLIGVELASMLLLGGLVGAYHLGWRKAPRSEVR
jgi:NADH-quinone oxidoreductase subunit J